MSGLPGQDVGVAEQQILDSIHSHKPGDWTDAVRIQSKLGRYYSEIGDKVRANRAYRRAAAGDEPVLPTPPPVSAAPVPDAPAFLTQCPPPPVPKADFSGKYWAYQDGALHEWEFHKDRTFLHTWIANGPGTTVHNSETGTFRLNGQFLLLEVTSSTGGPVVPGASEQARQSVGEADRSSEFRRLRIRFLQEGIVIGGVELRIKRW